MTTPINEEYIAEFTRAIGRVHQFINHGIGDETTPATALFAYAQLESVISSGEPYFGILATAPAGFQVSYDNIGYPQFVVVSQGQVAYNGGQIAVAGQQVSINRPFAAGAFTSGAHYGVRLGFSLQEAKRASQIYLTSVSVNASIGDNSLVVTDSSIVNDIGFPLDAIVGPSSVVRFSGWNAAGTALLVDPAFGSGALPASFYAGTRVNFIYQPRVQSIVGLPVESGFFPSGGDPSLFYYYPPIPDDWLPIANILCQNPYAPVVTTFGSGSAIQPTLVSWPTANSANPVFDTADAQSYLRILQANRTALRQVRDKSSTDQVIRAFEQYTNAVASSPATSVRAFYANLPFRADSFFATGVSFDGLARLEFSPEFAQAYFDATGNDLQHTYAMFRGDLYDHNSTLTGNPPSTVTANSYAAGSVPSSLTQGTYIYGVSAVFPAGETPPIYCNVVTPNLTTTFVNEIIYPNVSSATGYHIYRRATLAGDVSEYRLTTGGGLTGHGAFTNAQPAPDTDYTLTPGAGVAAIQFVAAGGNQLGGMSFQFRFATDGGGDPLITADLTKTITVAIYPDASGHPNLTAAVVTGTPILFSALQAIDPTSGSVTYVNTELISQMDATLTAGGTYWAVLNVPVAPSTGNIILRVKGASGSSLLRTSGDLTTWNTVSSTNPYFKLLSFLDYNRAGAWLTRRGIRLTGNTAIVARQLSVFVPPVDFTGVNTGGLPMYGSGSDPFVSATETPSTKNELIVTVVAQNGTGTPVTLTATVPQGSARGTRIPLGTASQVFDHVNDVQVRPGAAGNLRLGYNNSIIWSIYDFITVESMP